VNHIFNFFYTTS